MVTAGSSRSRLEVTGSPCSPLIPGREHPTGLAWARVHPKSNQLWPGDRTHDLCPPDRHNGSRFSEKVVTVTFLPATMEAVSCFCLRQTPILVSWCASPFWRTSLLWPLPSTLVSCFLPCTSTPILCRSCRPWLLSLCTSDTLINSLLGGLTCE